MEDATRNSGAPHPRSSSLIKYRASGEVGDNFN
jgi:hypothetical protein